MTSVPKNVPDEHWSDVFVSIAELAGDCPERVEAERAAAATLRSAGVGEETYEWLCSETRMVGQIRLATLLPLLLRRGGSA